MAYKYIVPPLKLFLRRMPELIQSQCHKRLNVKPGDNKPPKSQRLTAPAYLAGTVCIVVRPGAPSASAVTGAFICRLRRAAHVQPHALSGQWVGSWRAAESATPRPRHQAWRTTPYSLGRRGCPSLTGLTSYMPIWLTFAHGSTHKQTVS